jgi:hypothetical protein
MHLHFLSMINVNFDKQIPNLTENAKVLILSKLEKIRRVAQYYKHCEEHRAEDKTDNIMVF